MTLKDYVNSIHDKKIAVLGIGISNIPLLRLLLDSGIYVAAHDRKSYDELGDIASELESKGCRLILGEDYLNNIDADIIFRSPGIRPDAPSIIRALENGAVLTSEMEVFFQLCPCKIYAVTGSDGKTTTTTIISEMLKADGKNVYLGGNIGTPLLDKVDEMGPDDVCVLELSSFQLMTMRKTPNFAVVTNVAPNHLDVHKDMREYVEAKKNIFMCSPKPQTVVLNADNEITRSFACDAGSGVRFFSRRDAVENGAFVEDGQIFVSKDGKVNPVMPVEDIFLPGEHNVENYLAAFALLFDSVKLDSMVNVAKTFKGVPHRIEFVRELRGVKYYNDSIASSPSRTRAGLRSFAEKVILIAGGKDKGVPFDELGAEITQHVKALVLTGFTAEKIRDAVILAGGDMPITVEPDFKKAVLTAAGIAKNGDIVLLSPACTSFDHFKNFEERGNYFKEIINGLE